MSATKFEVLDCTGDVVMTFSADFAQASSPITVDGRSTPFQVADARHRPIEAAKLLNAWCRSEGGEAWPLGRTAGLTLRTYR